MIEVTYLNTAKQEKHTSFEDYNEFVRAQQACWIALPDATPVTKVTINGHDIGYKGQYGDLYFYIMKLDLADRKSTRLNSSHSDRSRMPSSA